MSGDLVETRRRFLTTLSSSLFVLLCVAASLGGAFSSFCVAVVLLILLGVEEAGAGATGFVLISILVGLIWPVVLLKRARREIRDPPHLKLKGPIIAQSDREGIRHRSQGTLELQRSAPAKILSSESIGNCNVEPVAHLPPADVLLPENPNARIRSAASVPLTAHRRQIEADDAHEDVGERYRMIDWVNVARNLVLGPILVFMVALLSAAQFSSGILSIVILVSGITAYVIAILFELQGYVFDTSADTLTFPRFLLRRSIPISGIRHANSQTTTKTRSYNPGRIVGEDNPTKVTTRTYAVNLSGKFGVRRVTFATKYKRDQFLQLLSDAAPDCYITRWT
jgi:hypothetical protein